MEQYILIYRPFCDKLTQYSRYETTHHIYTSLFVIDIFHKTFSVLHLNDKIHSYTQKKTYMHIYYRSLY